MKDKIQYEDFMKLDLRVAKIVAAEEIEGADKLLKITLDVGSEIGERTVAAGIKEWYAAEDLIGKLVVYLANLESRKLRGVVSQGMVLAAGSDVAVLLKPESDMLPGEIIR